LAFWARLRRKEIRQWRWSGIDLDILPARIRLRAKITKAERADTVPIHPRLADALKIRPTCHRSSRRCPT